jgi:metal-dependent HD superfamily phosphatase/phosphodiesterase
MGLSTLVAAVVLGLAAEPKSVELGFEAVHVPDTVKAGAKVKLVIVLAATKDAAGQTVHRTQDYLSGLKVAAVTRVEKPAKPEEAVKVKFEVSEEDAAKLDRLAKTVVAVVDTKTGKTTMRPPVLRLELMEK